MEETRNPADTKEPAIKREEILFLPDANFNANNVCVVTGAGPVSAEPLLLPQPPTI